MRGYLEERTTGPNEACLGVMNFFQNWESWKESLSETVRAAREVDPSDEHVIAVVEDVIDFLAQRTCPGSPEDRFISQIWDNAAPEEREALARVFIRIVRPEVTSSP